LNDAIADLRKRESSGTEQIGFVNIANETHRCEVHLPLIPVIRAWSVGHEFDGVIWTDLHSNFHEEAAEAFSVERARVYLLQLPTLTADRARRYILNAPSEVDTPLRRRMQEAGWLTRRVIH